MADMRTSYARDIVELLHDTCDGMIRIFGNIIPRSVLAAQTGEEGRSIYLHDPAGKVSAAYAAFTREALA